MGPDQALGRRIRRAARDAMATGLTVGIGGALGAAAGIGLDKKHRGASPLQPGELAYLAVMPETVSVFRAKRGALKSKPTDELLAQVPRSQVRASRYKKGKLVGVFELDFSDGSSWSFDVGRPFAKAALQVASALGSETP